MFDDVADSRTLVLATTNSTAQDPDSAPGWSLGDAHQWLGRLVSFVVPNPLKVTVNGVLVPFTYPGKPTGLAAGEATLAAAPLSWTAPEDPGTSEIAGYRVEWSADGSEPWTVAVDDTGSTATTWTHAGPAPATACHYRVRAISDAGASPPSDAARATTAAASDPAPLAGASTAKLVGNFSRAGSNSTPVGPSGSGFSARQYARAQSFTTGSGEGRGFVLSSVVVDVAAKASGATLSAFLRTESSGLPGTKVAELAAPAPAPVAAGHNEFMAPANTVLDGDTTYIVVFQGAGGVTALNVTASDGEDADSAAGWAIGDTRLSRSTQGDPWTPSSDSHALKVTVNGVVVPRTRPGRPAGLAAGTATETTVPLSWSAPATDGGAAITGYRVEYSTVGGRIWTLAEAPPRHLVDPRGSPAPHDLWVPGDRGQREGGERPSPKRSARRPRRRTCGSPRWPSAPTPARTAPTPSGTRCARR